MAEAWSWLWLNPSLQSSQRQFRFVWFWAHWNWESFAIAKLKVIQSSIPQLVPLWNQRRVSHIYEPLSLYERSESFRRLCWFSGDHWTKSSKGLVVVVELIMWVCDCRLAAGLGVPRQALEIPARLCSWLAQLATPANGLWKNCLLRASKFEQEFVILRRLRLHFPATTNSNLWETSKVLLRACKGYRDNHKLLWILFCL